MAWIVYSEHLFAYQWLCIHANSPMWNHTKDFSCMCNTLLWHHMTAHGILNHQQLNCVFSMFNKKNIKGVHQWYFVRGINLWTMDSPKKTANNAASIFISWCHLWNNFTTNGIMTSFFNKWLLFGDISSVNYKIVIKAEFHMMMIDRFL